MSRSPLPRTTGPLAIVSELQPAAADGPLEGRYANYFTVGHNAVEFVLDLGQCYAEAKQAHLHTRIVTSPAYAKALSETPCEAVARYEQTFGAFRGG